MKNSTLDSEISEIYRMALEDLGYDNVQIIFSDPKNSPQLIDEKGKPKSGTAFVDGKGVRTIIINAEDPKNSTRSGLIGTLSEEGSHIIGKIEGRQIATGTDEKGLESTGRATNEYFQDKYKGDDTAISIQSDGKDYSNVDFGENVGDQANEGAHIYNKDLRRYKYNPENIQDEINWWFGKGTFNINWKDYSSNEKYREKVNYYYFQAKYSLRDVKVISEEKDGKITISHRKGNKTNRMELYRVSEKEAIYHNVEYKNGTVYLDFSGKYKKYVNKNGYEIILDKDNKPVYSPSITGTYNYYTYSFKEIYNPGTYFDASGHLRDIELWIEYGSGPTDKTSPDLRKRLGDKIVGVYISQNYENLKEESKKTGGKIDLKEIEETIDNLKTEIIKQLNMNGVRRW